MIYFAYYFGSLYVDRCHVRLQIHHLSRQYFWASSNFDLIVLASSLYVSMYGLC